MPSREDLIRLSEELLTAEEQEGVQQKLDDGDFNGAGFYLLGHIDAILKRGELLEAEAASLYKRLGVPREIASRLRQRFVENRSEGDSLKKPSH